MEKECNDDFEQLKMLLGEELAWRVAEQFAGSPVYIPKSVLTRERHEAIRREFRAGADYRSLAEKYGYTTSYIRALVKPSKKQPNSIKGDVS